MDSFQWVLDQKQMHHNHISKKKLSIWMLKDKKEEKVSSSFCTWEIYIPYRSTLVVSYAVNV